MNITIKIENLIGVLNISNSNSEQLEQDLEKAVSNALIKAVKNVEHLYTDTEASIYQNQKSNEHPEFFDLSQAGCIKLSILGQSYDNLPDTRVVLRDLKSIKKSVNSNILQAYLVLFHPEILKIDYREFQDCLNSKNKNTLREFVLKKGYHLKTNCSPSKYVSNLHKGISKHLSSPYHYIF